MDGRKTGQWSVSVKICSISRTGSHPLALPLGELSPKVTERALHPVFPSPASLRSAAAPIGRGKEGQFMILFGSPGFCHPDRAII